MYPPKHHQDNNIENIKSVAIAYPFATLISAHKTKSFITHAPLILSGEKLIGHIDANNPHVSLLNNKYPITCVFQGPQTYISPSIYTTDQLPTWNYIIAHASGTVTEIKDSETIKKSIVAMTEFLEAPDYNYSLSLEDPRMDRLIPYIYGFEIDVQQWEGKFKLSQDKTPADIENAKHELITNNQKNVADFVNGLFQKHF